MRDSKYVFIICGAAGSGKTTVAGYLQEHFGMHRVITHTTRPPRPGERDGVDYYFESPATIKKRHLLEKVSYDGAEYGSSYEGLEAGWQKGQNDVIVLDTKGAATYRQKLGQRAVIIFLTVSNLDVLAERMAQRGDQRGALDSRLKSREYQRDLILPASLSRIAYQVVNDRWADTKKQLNALVGKLVSGKGKVC